MSAPDRRREVRGFTLAELIIAMGITMVIIVVLFQVFSATAAHWQSAEHRTDVFRDARAAVQLIGRDLSRAHITGDAQMLTLKEISGSYAKEAYAVSPMANAGKSSLCSVGYYTTWDENAKTYTLKRLFRDSDDAAAYLTGPNPNFGGLFVKNATQEEDLATYAWDLRFTPGDGANPVDPNATDASQWKWIEVRFKCISPAAAAKLKTMNISQATWAEPDEQPYRTLILPAEQQFFARVFLQQAR